MNNKINISYDEYKSHVSAICRDIAISDWIPDYVVGLTRGGLLPAVMISHYFNVPCHTLEVSLRDNPDICESNCWMSEDAFGYSRSKRKILIVDDINDSGATLNWIKNDWQSTCLPHSEEWQNIWGDNVRVAVIVDNLTSNAEIPISYSALDINKSEDDIWINFPYEDWWKR